MQGSLMKQPPTTELNASDKAGGARMALDHGCGIYRKKGGQL